MLTREYAVVADSPLGPLRLRGTDRGISGLDFPEERVTPDADAPAFFGEALRQIAEYFAGTRKEFNDLPLRIDGTDFQQDVWDRVSTVPYGLTRTYSQIALDIGADRAHRAVGTAVGRNRLAIIIPCHRIITVGSMDRGNYAWGTWRKEWLLLHERGN